MTESFVYSVIVYILLGMVVVGLFASLLNDGDNQQTKIKDEQKNELFKKKQQELQELQKKIVLTQTLDPQVPHDILGYVSSEQNSEEKALFALLKKAESMGADMVIGLTSSVRTIQHGKMGSSYSFLTQTEKIEDNRYNEDIYNFTGTAIKKRL